MMAQYSTERSDGFASLQRQIDEDHETLGKVCETVFRMDEKLDVLIGDRAEAGEWRRRVDGHIAKADSGLVALHGTGSHNPGLIQRVDRLEGEHRQLKGIFLGVSAIGMILAWINANVWPFTLKPL